MTSTFASDTLHGRLDELRRRHGLPGASLAVCVDREVTTAASGVLNLATRVRVTPESLFQIGSTTKTYTATMLMQLIDTGEVGVDDLLTTHLTDDHFGAGEIARTVTIRQLLTHTSGVFGDYYGEFGRGNDAVARYVTACAQLPQLFAPGATMSYCNSGFVALGRILELRTGQPFNAALRRRLLGPIGAVESATVPEEAILGRVAVGHLPQPGLKRRMVTPVWSLPASIAPAGALLCTTASDLVRFGRFHLDRGQAESGAQVLSADAVVAMRDRVVELPSRATLGVSAWGLGWMLFDLGGVAAFGHDGASIGQASFLRVVPDANFVFALLVNGPGGDALFDDLFSELVGEGLGIEVARALAPPDHRGQFELDPLVGTYAQPHLRITIRADGGRLVADFEPHPQASGLAAGSPSRDVPLEPLAAHPHAIDMVAEVGGQVSAFTFYERDTAGAFRYLHTGLRAFPRVSSRTEAVPPVAH
jgi:CubicO group peptidase (beta-lactamase class C family)